MNKKKLLPIALLGVLMTGQAGATLTGATDINDSGQIIGQFYDGDQAATRPIITSFILLKTLMVTCTATVHLRNLIPPVPQFSPGHLA